MRLFLGVCLVILFLWLQMAQRSVNSCGVCEAASMSEAVVSFVLSPLSLYSWMASTLLRFIVSLPALVLAGLQLTLLLLLVGPWCFATVCASFLLTCLQVGLYLLHMALVVGAMAFLALKRNKTPDRGDIDELQQNKLKDLIQLTGLEGRRRSGRRTAQQG